MKIKIEIEAESVNEMIIKLNVMLEKFSSDLVRPIEDLNLTVRTNNVLKNAGIKTIEELCQKTDDELLKLEFFSSKCLQEVKRNLLCLEI